MPHETLVIENVNLTLLNRQRLQLRRALEDSDVVGLSNVIAAEGLLEMLNTWYDTYNPPTDAGSMESA